MHSLIQQLKHARGGVKGHSIKRKWLQKWYRDFKNAKEQEIVTQSAWLFWEPTVCQKLCQDREIYKDEWKMNAPQVLISLGGQKERSKSVTTVYCHKHAYKEMQWIQGWSKGWYDHFCLDNMDRFPGCSWFSFGEMSGIQTYKGKGIFEWATFCKSTNKWILQKH